jgi:hypothetical protein
VFEGHRANEAVVKGIRRTIIGGAQVVLVDVDGGTDCVISSRNGGTFDTPAGNVDAKGPVTVVAFRDGKEAWRFDAAAK